MIITRTSLISGIVRNRDLPVTEEQLRRWQAGEVAQRAFPHLSADDREFIISGCTQEEWDEAFGEEE